MGFQRIETNLRSASYLRDKLIPQTCEHLGFLFFSLLEVPASHLQFKSAFEHVFHRSCCCAMRTKLRLLLYSKPGFEELMLDDAKRGDVLASVLVMVS